ncbi:uncharacterized protein BDR25DRAFT_317951 [Lindgomyces ingoldianus]|uniref:Uncharacterized protein n=1 Tax=Lindgomyces ingoldianus TaxID=673940 RepID=A0ACB6QGK5_9PLEO|nr:uncharacterized protein BDR25DRAFT_317951 [Lindgomyces ingoldianus]KAF2466154.1 hypothetical protein BDR25DRAFT_317951 [Lindgomyces ingoldianus]
MARAVLLLVFSLVATALAHSGHDEATTMMGMMSTYTGSIPTTFMSCGHGGPGRKRHDGCDDSSSHHSEFETEPGNYYSYTYNPSNALSYGPSDTGSSVRATSAAGSSASSAAAASSKATGSSPSATTQSGATSTRPSALQITGTGAANAHYPEILGAVAGGLIAGLALA